MRIFLTKCNKFDLQTFNDISNFLKTIPGFSIVDISDNPVQIFDYNYFDKSDKEISFIEYDQDLEDRGYKYVRSYEEGNSIIREFINDDGFIWSHSYPVRGWERVPHPEFGFRNPNSDYFFGRFGGMRLLSDGQITSEDILILLTDNNNDKYTFSEFQLSAGKKNIVVFARDWFECVEDGHYRFHLPEEKVHYAISYIIIENILKVLMIPYLNTQPNLNHEIKEGCIFECCTDKNDYYLKILTGNVCDFCASYINSSPKSEEFLPFALNGISLIRNKFIYRPPLNLKEVILDDFVLDVNPASRTVGIFRGKVLLVAFELKPLEFALYYCILAFSKKGNGIRRAQLMAGPDGNKDICDFINRIYSYSVERPKAISGLSEGKKFDEYRSKINATIRASLTNKLQGIPHGIITAIQISPSLNGVYRISFTGEIREV